MWVLPKFVLVYGFIMQVLYLMYIGTICILYHDMGIVMGIPNHNIDLREPCMYNILGFYSMMNVYRIINSLVEEFVLLLSIMGRVPKSHSIHVQNLTKSLFSNKDLVWRSKICHGRRNKMTFQFVYVPYVRISKFLKGERR